MKKKMDLAAEIDLTQDSVVQLTSWCGQIALHELWGLGRTRLDRLTRRQEQLGSASLAVVMQPDKNGMPQTEKARQLRAEALPAGVPAEFRVPALRTPRTRREQQLKIVGDRAATMAWQLMALACVQELGFGADRLNRLYAEMRRNYEQLNQWGKEDGIDVAMEKLRRCACDALQTEEIVVENIDDEKTVQALSQSYKKAGGRVHQAGRDDGRRTQGREAGRSPAAAFGRRGAAEDRGGEGTNEHGCIPEEGLTWA